MSNSSLFKETEQCLFVARFWHLKATEYRKVSHLFDIFRRDQSNHVLKVICSAQVVMHLVHRTFPFNRWHFTETNCSRIHAASLSNLATLPAWHKGVCTVRPINTFFSQRTIVTTCKRTFYFPNLFLIFDFLFFASYFRFGLLQSVIGDHKDFENVEHVKEVVCSDER